MLYVIQNRLTVLRHLLFLIVWRNWWRTIERWWFIKQTVIVFFNILVIDRSTMYQSNSLRNGDRIPSSKKLYRLGLSNGWKNPCKMVCKVTTTIDILKVDIANNCHRFPHAYRTMYYMYKWYTWCAPFWFGWSGKWSNSTHTTNRCQLILYVGRSIFSTDDNFKQSTFSLCLQFKLQKIFGLLIRMNDNWDSWSQ